MDDLELSHHLYRWTCNQLPQVKKTRLTTTQDGFRYVYTVDIPLFEVQLVIYTVDDTLYVEKEVLDNYTKNVSNFPVYDGKFKIDKNHLVYEITDFSRKGRIDWYLNVFLSIYLRLICHDAVAYENQNASCHDGNTTV